MGSIVLCSGYTMYLCYRPGDNFFGAHFYFVGVK